MREEDTFVFRHGRCGITMDIQEHRGRVWAREVDLGAVQRPAGSDQERGCLRERSPGRIPTLLGMLGGPSK